MSVKGGLRDQIRATLMENMGLKILSLCCAVALYVFTHGPATAQRTFSVSVLSIMPPEAARRQLITQLPTEVGITLNGPRAQLDELHADDIGPLQLDLKSGPDKIDIEEKMFHIHPGLTVQQIFPPRSSSSGTTSSPRTSRCRCPRPASPRPATR